VVLFFCGRSLLGLLADHLSSHLAKETGTEAEGDASAFGLNVPQVETRQIVPTEVFSLAPSIVTLKIRLANRVSISHMFVPDTLEALSNVYLESNIFTKAGVTPPIEVAELQPYKVTASIGALSESLTNTPESPMVVMRHSPSIASASYRDLFLCRSWAPPHRSRIGYRTISTISAALRPSFGPSRENISPTIGVPERDFTPELPGRFGELSHPLA